MPRMLIDNTPPSFVFQDGNQLTDGMANFGRALVQAPIAAAQIRDERAQRDLANVWRQEGIDRQDRQEAMANVWRQREFDSSAEQKKQAQENWVRQMALNELTRKAHIEDVQADNTRQSMAMFGHGLDRAAGRGIEAIKAVFGGARNAAGAGGGSDRPTSAILKAAHELADAEAHRRGVVEYDETGKRKIVNPKEWNTILKESYDMHGIKVPKGWHDAQAVTNAAGAGPTPLPSQDDGGPNFMTRALQGVASLSPIDPPADPTLLGHPISWAARKVGNLFYGGSSTPSAAQMQADPQIPTAPPSDPLVQKYADAFLSKPGWNKDRPEHVAEAYRRAQALLTSKGLMKQDATPARQVQIPVLGPDRQ